MHGGKLGVEKTVRFSNVSMMVTSYMKTAAPMKTFCVAMMRVANYVKEAPMKTFRVASLCFDKTDTTTDLDSHADTCVVGGNVLLTHDFNRPVKVNGFDTTKKSDVYSTVSAVTAYDDPHNGQVYMLVINQAISVPQMHHNLLCPMQMRQNGLGVDEVPKFQTLKPTAKSHAIVAINAEGEELIIPLQLRGVTSCFNTRKPTIEEYLSSENVFELTNFDNDGYVC